ncbi:class I SAM-dependent methyltransferase [Candidatus Kaiserbacteria bacterium]|nr:class I SAM-dependent methyltransferase [Candidatus Kaiserbacteria bacterium]
MNIDLEVPPSCDLGLPCGWFSANDIAAYRRLAEQIPDESVLVEVGVWQGRSLCSIAEQIIKKRLRVYAVDTFKGTPGVGVVHDCGGKLQEVFEKHSIEFGLRDYVTVLRGDSVAVAENLAESCALVFIDGDHSPEKVTADVQAWLRRLAPEGLLCGHDYAIVGTVVEKILRPYSISVTIDPNSEVWWADRR